MVWICKTNGVSLVADISVAGGVRTSRQYVGCIRNLRLDFEQQDLNAAVAEGDVNRQNCPVGALANAA